MAAPVLVRAYTNTANTGQSLSATGAAAHVEPVQALPPIASYTFASILREADSAEFQHAIDGIAELCAKNRMSLADEYASHMPPLGEITASSSLTPAAARSYAARPGMRGGRALTSVPEASSSSSEGSRKGKKRKIFSFRRQDVEGSEIVCKIRIGSMGRTLSVGSTTAMAAHLTWPSDEPSSADSRTTKRPVRPQRTPSEATLSLQRLLVARHRPDAG